MTYLMIVSGGLLAKKKNAIQTICRPRIIHHDDTSSVDSKSVNEPPKWKSALKVTFNILLWRTAKLLESLQFTETSLWENPIFIWWYSKYDVTDWHQLASQSVTTTYEIKGPRPSLGARRCKHKITATSVLCAQRACLRAWSRPCCWVALYECREG